MIHRIELSANDSALVAKGCPLNISLPMAVPRTLRGTHIQVVFTKKTWDQIRATYDSRLIRVTLGGS